MKNLKTILLADKLRLIGILFILVSISIFSTADSLENSSNAMSVFFTNYLFSVVYTIITFVKTFKDHKWKLSKGKLDYTALMLVLWFISAFSLNREMNVFEISTGWLSVYIWLASITMIMSAFQEFFTKTLTYIFVFALGLSLVLFAYYTIYLIPMYIFGILGAVFIGISLHVYVPVCLFIVSIRLTNRQFKKNKLFILPLIISIFIPIALVSVFTLKWNDINSKITHVVSRNTLKESKLPQWVVISQTLPTSYVTEKVLKSGMVYTTLNKRSSWFWGGFENSGFDEPKKHDPLVLIAALICGEPTLEDQDKIKILKSMYDSRHLAEERLWSGDHLETATVVTDIMIYPEYRMAYTEKTLTVRNTNQRWRSEEEAIYTFQLPEGSVVSALSLWIEGIEEKARLTTKSKADSAYKTIVGVESRDPSVIHWQEGNTVSVRVFPCNNKEDRKFRIGISSPLQKLENQLTYLNPSFSGPSFKDAKETIQLKFSTNPQGLKSDLPYKKNEPAITDRNYVNKWGLSLNSTTLSTNSFQFGSDSYQLEQTTPINTSFKPTAIYLDINNAWSSDELAKLWNELKGEEVYAFNEKMIRLTDDNFGQTCNALQKLNFSLFPFYEIKDSENAMVITKSTEKSPNLSDLSKSSFQVKTSGFLSTSKPFHLFNLSDELSPYLKTLKEFRAFTYSQGSYEMLVQQLKDSRFKTNIEAQDKLLIPVAEMAIRKTNEATASQAPDHLLRLFAYNDILKNVGTDYFKKDFIKPHLIAAADQAFIVSPVSSLIVLETQKDYERFNITESKNSLGNASHHSSGAAPEPHEWMLILLTAGIIIYFSYQSGHFNKIKLLWN